MKFSIVTLGCKVNQYDSQVTRELLGAHWGEAGPGEKADVVVVNTCTVTMEADRQARRALRQARIRNPGAKVVAAGCYARIRGADLVAEGLADAVAGGPGSLLAALALPAAQPAGVSRLAGRTRAFLKVQDGCDRRCSFCAVPLARGRSMSRAVEELEAEARRLAEGGAPEIVICGVRLNAYRDPSTRPQEGARSGLAALVEKLAEAAAPARLRLSSIYPGDVDEGLVKLLTTHPQVCRHAHLPVQSGSDRILHAMRRGYQAADIRELAASLRTGAPDMGLTADVIAGFPGETEADFRETMALLEEGGFHRLHVFPFSPRPGTPAASMPQVPRGEVLERAGRLMELGRKLLRRAQERLVGREAEVVLEGRLRGGWRKGVTGDYHTVMFSGSLPDGSSRCRVRITDLADGELHGVAA